MNKNQKKILKRIVRFVAFNQIPDKKSRESSIKDLQIMLDEYVKESKEVSK